MQRVGTSIGFVNDDWFGRKPRRGFTRSRGTCVVLWEYECIEIELEGKLSCMSALARLPRHECNGYGA